MDFVQKAKDAFTKAWDWVRRRPLLAILSVALLISVEVAVLATGVVAERRGWPHTLRQRIEAMLPRQPQRAQDVEWHIEPLSQYTVEWARLRVGYPGLGGAIARVNGNIVIATPQGHFNYLSRNNTLAPIALRAPMNLDQLNESPLANDPLFEIVGVRVHDLLARQVGPTRWDLYATFSRYVRANCFEFVVAKAQLEAQDGVVRTVSPNWEDIYVARPGCIRYKDRSWRFVGEQAAGRMQMLNDHVMLISIGDHQFDGFNDAHNAPMDPQWDLGKVIALDLETRTARIFATGLRNPQGLLVMRDGRVIETEHGPRGGDEINHLRRGRNYGWPLVTYGMNYGYPRRAWLTDPSPGGHGGFERPLIAFVPSIGISNLTQPSADEFPLWADNDLLVESLRAGTLFHVRLDGERVAYVEPVPLDGERLRDIVTMRDGRVVILTDSGNLIFLRNADRHANEPRHFVVTGLSTVARDAPPSENLSPEQHGRQVFALGCASCHSLDGEVGIGPPLNGVVGRRIGSVEGFQYSPALSGKSDVWTGDLLVSFMTDPERQFHGTTMPPTTLSWTLAPDIVAYLRTTRGTRSNRTN